MHNFLKFRWPCLDIGTKLKVTSLASQDQKATTFGNGFIKQLVLKEMKESTDYGIEKYEIQETNNGLVCQTMGHIMS